MIQPNNTQQLFEVTVLYGGNSAEREISLQTGEAVINALESRGHSVTPVDPKTTAIEDYDWSATDVVFICLHGEFGEDGQIQRLLENANVCYTGSNSSVSELAYTKSATKKLLQKKQIPTPAFKLIHETDTATDINAAVNELGFPLVIKPNSQGSSIGINLVNDKDELPRALSQAFHFDEYILMEEAVLGSEWTVAFMDEEVLPLIKIHSNKALFDFEAKYVEEETGYSFEFEETSNIIKKIEFTGRSVINALGTEGFTRIDIRLDKMNTPFVLEVNTIPGMTEHSLFPKAASRAGISFSDLCDRYVRTAWEKFHQQGTSVSDSTTCVK